LQLAKHHHSILLMLRIHNCREGHLFNFDALYRSLVTAWKTPQWWVEGNSERKIIRNQWGGGG
jgi:hypothetical protein